MKMIKRCRITTEHSPELIRKLYAKVKPALLNMTDAERSAFETALGYDEVDKALEAMNEQSIRT
jgi:hypothetical protein|tara:strand:- start:113 stop:304 length:192 start_codon:yes stop_codon:yes gene_type:complete